MVSYEYLVSFDVKTKRAFTENEICKLLGIKGDELKLYNSKENRYWRFESRIKQVKHIDEHIKDLASVININRRTLLYGQLESYGILIGVLVNTKKIVFPQIQLSPSSIEIIGNKWPGSDLEVIIYPSLDLHEVEKYISANKRSYRDGMNLILRHARKSSIGKQK